MKDQRFRESLKCITKCTLKNTSIINLFKLIILPIFIKNIYFFYVFTSVNFILTRHQNIAHSFSIQLIWIIICFVFILPIAQVNSFAHFVAKILFSVHSIHLYLILLVFYYTQLFIGTYILFVYIYVNRMSTWWCIIDLKYFTKPIILLKSYYFHIYGAIY